MSPAPATLYGILDLARAPDLYPHIERLAPEAAACLFEGRLHPEVLRVSPHLVELGPHDPLSVAWRGRGWGEAWGILLSSHAPLPVVRRRLRHFTQARLPDGQGPVLFRFWDPRVFRTYLPLVEPDQIGAWFQDIDRYLVEDEGGQGSLRYELKGGGLRTEAGPRPAR